jgi:dipeptidyl aminopeptidase/acylaminoacyl peptidase
MGPDSGAAAAPRSHICIIDADGENERVIYATPEHFEAPNWSPDGTYLLLNSRGQLWRLPLAGDAEPEPVPTGAVTGINNDHGISPDGSRFAISAGADLHAAGRRRRAAPGDRKRRRAISTAGRPTAARWPTAPSGTASSTSTRSPPMVRARRCG